MVVSDILARLLALFRVLFDTHMVIARAEAERDFGRVAMGLALVGAALLLAGTTWLLVQIAALFFLYDRGLDWPVATLALAGANTGLAVICGLVARSALRRPLLPETRALLQRSMGTLLG